MVPRPDSPPRIALLVPSTFLIDGPLCRLAEEVGLQPSLLRVPSPAVADTSDAGAVADMVRFMGDTESLAAAARLAREVEPDVIAWGCTSGSFIDGGQMGDRQAAAMEAAAGVPAITTSQAMIAALAGIGARRIAVITPYLAPIGQKFVHYLEGAGLTVTGEAHLGGGSDAEVGALTPRAFADALAAMPTDQADAIVIPCTAVDEYHIRPALAESGLPIIFANRATLELAARRARR
jgi:maleate cis-trans isomerase